MCYWVVLMAAPQECLSNLNLDLTRKTGMFQYTVICHAISCPYLLWYAFLITPLHDCKINCSPIWYNEKVRACPNTPLHDCKINRSPIWYNEMVRACPNTPLHDCKINCSRIWYNEKVRACPNTPLHDCKINRSPIWYNEKVRACPNMTVNVVAYGMTYLQDYTKNKMSHVMTKPVKTICKQ